VSEWSENDPDAPPIPGGVQLKAPDVNVLTPRSAARVLEKSVARGKTPASSVFVAPSSSEEEEGDRVTMERPSEIASPDQRVGRAVSPEGDRSKGSKASSVHTNSRGSEFRSRSRSGGQRARSNQGGMHSRNLSRYSSDQSSWNTAQVESKAPHLNMMNAHLESKLDLEALEIKTPVDRRSVVHGRAFFPDEDEKKEEIQKEEAKEKEVKEKGFEVQKTPLTPGSKGSANTVASKGSAATSNSAASKGSNAGKMNSQDSKGPSEKKNMVRRVSRAGIQDDEPDLDIMLELKTQIKVRSRITAIAPSLDPRCQCIAGTNDGRLILVYDNQVVSKEMHHRAVTCISQLDTDRHVIGFVDGYVIVYNTRKESRYEVRPSRESITALSCSGGKIAIAVGGSVSVYSHKKRSEITRIAVAKDLSTEAEDTVTTIKFVTKKMLALGTYNGHFGVYTLDKVRKVVSKKTTPMLAYKKRIGRRIRDMIVRVDALRKKRATAFSARLLFDTKKESGSGTTVIDISLSDFDARHKEKIGVVGVSMLAMRHPCEINGNLVTATQEGLLVWSGNDSDGAERMCLCGDKGVANYAWAEDKLYTIRSNEILVWSAPMSVLTVKKTPSNPRIET